jgi:hypothetical protein
MISVTALPVPVFHRLEHASFSCIGKRDGHVHRHKIGAASLPLPATPALAESPAPLPQNGGDKGATSITLDTVEVISEKLNTARL